MLVYKCFGLASDNAICLCRTNRHNTDLYMFPSGRRFVGLGCVRLEMWKGNIQLKRPWAVAADRTVGPKTVLKS